MTGRNRRGDGPAGPPPGMRSDECDVSDSAAGRVDHEAAAVGAGAAAASGRGWFNGSNSCR